MHLNTFKVMQKVASDPVGADLVFIKLFAQFSLKLLIGWQFLL